MLSLLAVVTGVLVLSMRLSDAMRPSSVHCCLPAALNASVEALGASEALPVWQSIRAANDLALV